MAEYFADTYAIIQYLIGKKNYAQYFEGNRIITTRLNLMELYFWTLKEQGEYLADEYFDSLIQSTVDFSDSSIKDAMKFRLENRGKGISYIDAVGYQVALESKVKFLTGDRAFRGIGNVEFVE